MRTHKDLCEAAKHILREYIADHVGQPKNDYLEQLVALFDGPFQRRIDSTPPALTLNELQQLASRTLPTPGAQHWFGPPMAAGIYSPEFRHAEFNKRVDLLHALLGLAGEVGELIDPAKKAMFYGKPLDVENVREEAGDLLWYIAGPLCRALGCTLEELAAANVAKLRKRYPERYSDEYAISRADKAGQGAPFDETGTGGNPK